RIGVAHRSTEQDGQIGGTEHSQRNPQVGHRTSVGGTAGGVETILRECRDNVAQLDRRPFGPRD
ncbi:MAG TPA: hypothetical protein VHH34_24985, partial [Pseudonocardiaceae bacterium]|nr:hypothetical protein [Pseudonocardiaceae bacterium]